MTTLNRQDAGAAARTEIAWQRFSVPFDYPVAFTRGLFHADNPLFADMLSRREAGKRHRAIVYVDDGIAGALPDLTGRVRAYADAHSDRIELIGSRRSRAARRSRPS